MNPLEDASAPVDLLLTQRNFIRIVHDRGLADQVGSAWNLEPGSGEGTPLCTIRVQADGYAAPAGALPAEHGRVPGEGGRFDSLAVDFSDLQAGCTLDCSPRVSPRALLPWVNLLLLEADVIPLHASAFVWQGCGVVVGGSAHTGKTGILLAAAHDGAEVVGDECVWLMDGGRMRGLSLEMDIRLDYLREFPAYLPRIPPRDLRRAGRYRLLAGMTRFPARNLSRKLDERARVRVDARKLFGPRAFAGTMNRLFLSAAGADSRLSVRSIHTHGAVERVREIQLREYEPVRRRYARYRHLFPGRRNVLLDHLEDRLSALLTRALHETETFVLEHPYPVEAREMLRAVQETC